jgi:UDP-N-acetylmuramate-alanine ligase
LLKDFKNCFINTDELIIPNIYASRDSKEDKEKINTDKFIKNINHEKIIN